MSLDGQTGAAYEALLFDLDGVLVDSAATVEAAWRRFAGRNELSAERVLEVAHGRPSRAVIEVVAPHLDAVHEAQLVEAAQVESAAEIHAIGGARALLAGLPPHRWAVVTSGTHALARARLAGASLPAPLVLVTADDVSRGKPDPEGYLTAARLLGAAPARCIVIEDAPAGIAAAVAAGMHSIGVATTHTAAALTTATTVIETLESIVARPDATGAIRVVAAEATTTASPGERT